ncbi:hypothetical protein D3C71_1960590 [compost metagenome]
MAFCPARLGYIGTETFPSAPWHAMQLADLSLPAAASPAAMAGKLHKPTNTAIALTNFIIAPYALIIFYATAAAGVAAPRRVVRPH